MVGHSIVQGCGGFPYLAESSYYYLATGDISQAVDYITVADVYDVDAVNYIEQVNYKILFSQLNATQG